MHVVRMALAACGVAVIALVGTVPVSTQGGSEYTYDIVFSGDDKVCVGNVGTVNVQWITSRDVTRSRWSADGVDEPEAAFEGATSGSDSRTFSSESEGTFLIGFALWHHTQGRQASNSILVTVEECLDAGCPAAPAIANEYLDELGHTGNRGYIISDVAAAMTAGQFGADSCDPSYAEAVRAFVDLVR